MKWVQKVVEGMGQDGGGNARKRRTSRSQPDVTKASRERNICLPTFAPGNVEKWNAQLRRNGDLQKLITWRDFILIEFEVYKHFNESAWRRGGEIDNG